MPPKLWESGTSVIARDNTNCINFFFHSSYDDPKILDEISLDDFLFLNLAWVTDIFWSRNHSLVDHVLIWYPLLTGETLAERSLEPWNKIKIWFFPLFKMSSSVGVAKYIIAPQVQVRENCLWWRVRIWDKLLMGFKIKRWKCQLILRAMKQCRITVFPVG